MSAVLLTAGVLFVLLKICSRGRFNPTFLRAVVVCGAMVVARLYMSHAGWGANIVTALAVLFALSFLLLLELMKSPLLTSCLSAIVVVLLFMFMEQAAFRLSAAAFPDGPTLLEYMGLEFGTEDEVRMEHSKRKSVRPSVKHVVVHPPEIPEEIVASNQAAVVISDPDPVMAPSTAAVEVVNHTVEEDIPAPEIPAQHKEPVQLPEEKAQPAEKEKPDAEKFMRISMHLGVAYVPNDDEVMHEWIAATQELRMKGFVSLGDEAVILRADGAMLKKGETWEVDYSGYVYRFTIETITQDRVSMRAAGREALKR